MTFLPITTQSQRGKGGFSLLSFRPRSWICRHDGIDSAFL